MCGCGCVGIWGRECVCGQEAHLDVVGGGGGGLSAEVDQHVDADSVWWCRFVEWWCVNVLFIFVFGGKMGFDTVGGYWLVESG
jgi:hypothetical protein